MLWQPVGWGANMTDGAASVVAWLVGLAVFFFFILPRLVRWIAGPPRAEATAGAPPSQETSVQAPTPQPRGRAGVWIIVIVALGGGIYYLTRPDFSERQIDEVRASIEDKFSKRDGVKVLKVVMMRKAQRELVGFVSLSVSGHEITSSCHADMAADGSTYLWECGK